MKSPNRILVLLIAATYSLAFSSCSDEKCTNPSNGGTYIFGYAFLDTAITHSDILVRIIQTDDTTYTSANGRYEFSCHQPGTCTVVASYEGYIPSFSYIHVSGTGKYRVPTLDLNLLTCMPRDSIPDGYPLGIRFCADISFTVPASSYYMGDSLFIAAWEYYLPPLHCFGEESPADAYDVLVISSLGDKEIKHVDRYLGSIPEVWRFGYILDSAASTNPMLNNGVIEVEPAGGWVTAIYQSYWLKRYVCRPIEMLPNQ